MHVLEHAILDAFRKRPQEVLSTSDLVEEVMKKEMQEVTVLLASPEISAFKQGKRKKAQLHRKLLYHLNKLVEDELLKVRKTQGRGEKCYVLALSGDVTIRSGRKQVTIHKPKTIDIAGNVELHSYRSENWLRKINAVFLEGAELNTLSEAADEIERIAPHINDVIGLLRFDKLLETTDTEVFLERLRRQPCAVVLEINTQYITKGEAVVRFCELYAENRPKNVQIVFTVNSTILREQKETLQQIIALFMERTIKINFHNSSVHKAPVICGTAGPYTMSEQAWKEYKKVRSTTKGVAVCGATVIVDAHKGGILHQLCKQATETLFAVERNRTVKIKGIFFGLMDDMIRCWNHELKKDTLIEEIRAAQEVTTEFATMQERVYRACGMPTRFRVRISSAFGKIGGLSARAYKKIAVHGMNTLQEVEYRNYLQKREELAEELAIDRVRVFRKGDANPEEVLREATFVLNSYALPYITYDFSELRGDVKLTTFMEEEHERT